MGVEMLSRTPARPEGIVVRASASPIRGEDGIMLGAVAVAQDITEVRRREEREREQLRAAEQERNEMVQRLRLAVHELSTPILEVWEDVIVLPVIGIMDSQRSAEMMDRLLAAIEHKQSRFVIVDITGVEVIDSATAQQFINLVTAVEYLGARCVLTGTRRSVAQTLVSLGLDLGPLTMLRTLKHGLRECMRRMEAEDARAGGKGAARPHRPS
jgi:rsbT co-antagonist protein RsbR